MSIDQCIHSLFGASKVAADVLVQEYGRCFGMKTACFRGGTLTGPQHSATQLHGFLAYLMCCVMTETPYTIFGYKGKQVRDAIHSNDLIRAFDAFSSSPASRKSITSAAGASPTAPCWKALTPHRRLPDRRPYLVGRRPYLVDRRQRRVRNALS